MVANAAVVAEEVGAEETDNEECNYDHADDDSLATGSVPVMVRKNKLWSQTNTYFEKIILRELFAA